MLVKSSLRRQKRILLFGGGAVPQAFHELRFSRGVKLFRSGDVAAMQRYAVAFARELDLKDLARPVIEDAFTCGQVEFPHALKTCVIRCGKLSGVARC